MFRLFEDWDGSFIIIPAGTYDDLWSLLFMGIFVLLMCVLGANAAPYMTLPILAVYAGMVISMYVKSWCSLLVAFPFLVYGWAATCYVITYVSIKNSLGPIGLMGWLVMAIAACFILIAPVIALTYGVGIIVCIPLAMLWIASLLFSMQDSDNNYKVISQKWTMYAFRILGIAMLIALVVALVSRIREVARSETEQKVLFNNIVSTAVGIGIVAGFSIFSYLIPGGIVMSLLLLAVLAALAFALKTDKGSFSITSYAFLPVLVCWIFKPVVYQESIYRIMYLQAADKVLDIGNVPLMHYLAERFASPTLAGFTMILSKILNFLINLFLRIFDSSLQAFVLPEIIAIPFGFLAMCLAVSLGMTFKQKICKKE